MADAIAETQASGGQDGPEFSISPKTTLSQLMECRSPGGNVAFKLMVAKDMIANAKELTSEVAWGEVINEHLKASNTGRPLTGELALAHSAVVPRTAVIAKELGVGMDDPRIVYLSGVHIAWSLDTDVRQIDERIQEIETGKRQFGSPEARENALAKSKADAGKLGAFYARIKAALAEFTESRGITAEQQELLRTMLYADPKNLEKVKRSLQLLKEGKLAEAQALMTTTSGVK